MKIRIVTYLFLFFLVSCGYQPLYSSKGQTFSIGEIEFSGEKYLTNNFAEKIKRFQDTKNEIFDLQISLNRSKNTAAKDKKGNPTQFSMSISITLKINNEIEKTFLENSTYNNSEDKFDLRKYEDNLIQNMTETIFSEMILFLQTNS